MLGAISMDMAGDIWSTGAFSFESPLKDLLDTNDFTLEQLLAEDELLQELRGCHQRLIAFFSTEEAVTKLVQYVILSQSSPTSDAALEHDITAPQMNGGNVLPDANATVAVTALPKEPGAWLQQHLEDVKSGSKKNPDNDPALKHIRFPYMACEIICCEIPGVVDTLVDGYCVLSDDHTDIDADTCVSPTASESDPTSSLTEIVTSDSQGDMVEVVAKVAVKADATEGPRPKNRMRILDLLFSFLRDTPVGQLDDYRAGYFDKVLTVLFRKRPDDLTVYINNGGAMGRDVLIQSMLNHLYSHSIMQITQRLLLPQRPVEQQPLQLSPEGPAEPLEAGNLQGGGGDEIMAGDDDAVGMVQCDWGTSPEVLDMLLDTLVGPPRTIPPTLFEPQREDQILDLSLNASEVLITIIQNSMLSSTTMLSLTSTDTIARIVDAATTLPDPSYFSPHESLLTSAMNVLESLVLQLGGYGAVGTMSLLPEEELALSQQRQLQQDGACVDDIFEEDPPEPTMNAAVPAESADEAVSDVIVNSDMEDDKHLISDLGSMLIHLPTLLERLSSLLRHLSTKSWTSPTQFSQSEPQQLLGNSRLRIVRVLESLVLLGDPDVDSRLVQSDCLEISLDFFWEFQWCSMLHQSVANLLVHVFEGQNTRYEMQEYFLVKCNLLGRLMDSFMEGEVPQETGFDGLTPSSSGARLTDIQNLSDADVAVGNATLSSGESDRSDILNTSLHVSEDDVDAVMETQTDVKDTDAAVESIVDVVIEAVTPIADVSPSKEVTRVSDLNIALPAQSFRFGYMGHVIIICQALVHAYTSDIHEQEMMDGEGAESGNFDGVQQNGGYVEKEVQPVVMGGYLDSERGIAPSDVTDRDEHIGPKDDFGEPLLLFEIVHTHELAERWHEFVDTTLAAETAVQSTPLGGFVLAPGMDPMMTHRPGLADEGYMMGDDGEGPPVPPRGMLGGGDAIDMDDHDLDVAASMMAGLNLQRSPMSGGGGDDDLSQNSGDSEKSYNSGETASEKSGYAFDDPLGKAGGLGIELGKLTRYNHGETAAGSEVADDGSHSSSDEEPESNRSVDGDVPVMDLFAGNFNYDQPADQAPEFANFADFDTGAGTDGNETATTPVDPFGETPTEPVSNSTDLDDLFDQGSHTELLLELDDTPAQLVPIENDTDAPLVSIENDTVAPLASIENDTAASLVSIENDTDETDPANPEATDASVPEETASTFANDLVAAATPKADVPTDDSAAPSATALSEPPTDTNETNEPVVNLETEIR